MLREGDQQRRLGGVTTVQLANVHVNVEELADVDVEGPPRVEDVQLERQPAISVSCQVAAPT